MKIFSILVICLINAQLVFGQSLQSEKIKSWYWSPATVITCENDQESIQIAPYLHRDRTTKEKIRQVKINEETYHLKRHKGSWHLADLQGNTIVHSSRMGWKVYTRSGTYNLKKPAFGSRLEYLTEGGSLVTRAQFKKKRLTVEKHLDSADSNLLMLMAMNQLLEAKRQEALEVPFLFGVVCD